MPGRRSMRSTRRGGPSPRRSEEHTSELQSQSNLVCRLLLEKKKKKNIEHIGGLALTHRPMLCVTRLIATHADDVINQTCSLHNRLLTRHHSSRHRGS